VTYAGPIRVFFGIDEETVGEEGGSLFDGTAKPEGPECRVTRGKSTSIRRKRRAAIKGVSNED
jgi:hypothetical protein